MTDRVLQQSPTNKNVFSRRVQISDEYRYLISKEIGLADPMCCGFGTEVHASKVSGPTWDSRKNLQWTYKVWRGLRGDPAIQPRWATVGSPGALLLCRIDARPPGANLV